jgi:hypothetical protein
MMFRALSSRRNTAACWHKGLRSNISIVSQEKKNLRTKHALRVAGSMLPPAKENGWCWWIQGGKPTDPRKASADDLSEHR